MRTTVTLDPDTEAGVRRLMVEKGIGFKRALNEALRAGLGDQRATFATRVRSMGRPVVNLDRALQLAGDLEDDELVRNLRTGR